MAHRAHHMPIRTLLLIALTCGALVFGLTLSHVLQSPGSRGLSGREWLNVQHTFYGGFAIVGGAAEVIGLVTAVILTFCYVSTQKIAAAIAPLIAALCLAGTLAVFWFGNRPVNAKIVTWTGGSLPPGWQAYRDTWETAHAISALLGAIAFFALAVMLVSRQRVTSVGR